jgi:hypothetical protein
MTRLYSAIGLCMALLLFEAAVFLPSSKAKTDVVGQLLQVPAPPPPNPLARRSSRQMRDAEFLSKAKPPKDSAPIEDLVDYWSENQRSVRNMNYTPEASEKTLERLYKEVDRDPQKLPRLMGAFPDTERSAEVVKGIYDREGTTGVLNKDDRNTVKQWLIYHSPYFSTELARLAERSGDTDAYVSGQDELLALARVDFDRARPLIDRLYSGGGEKPSRVLARWALYRHALDTNSTGDIDRYRDELKATVENKNLSGPTRDLAMDALVTEKEWPGRDDWYTSLLSDETLADLQGYTGLTTLINASPPEKYIDKMIALLKSDNKTVRSAAIRNLTLQINSKRSDLIAALLPWLEDPSWANDIGDMRSNIVLALRTVKLPESVPALIKLLDEKKKQMVYAGGSSANASVANAPAANALRPSNSSSASYPGMTEVERYAYRYSAVLAQGDPAAVPALRRIVNETEGYERQGVVEAILKCGGFSVPEQADALEAVVKKGSDSPNFQAHTEDSNANAPVSGYLTTARPPGIPSPDVLRSGRFGRVPDVPSLSQMLGELLLRTNAVSDELVMAMVGRVEALDLRDPKLAMALRKIMLRWTSPKVNLLLLRDLKNDRADADPVVRLLSQRKLIRQDMSSDVFDAKTGTPAAAGITACVIEDSAEYDAILGGENTDTKTALLACARLIRAPLPVAKVAEFVKSTDRRLATAAERYLESEDSPAARAIVLGLHPGEARIMGATTAFFPNGRTTELTGPVLALFESVGPDGGGETGRYYSGTYFPDLPVSEDIVAGGSGSGETDQDWQKAEKLLREEVKKDDSLLGVYGYDGNYVRLYRDKAVFSWDDDESRYRERPLSQYELDSLKSYLTDQHVDELAPFLQCGLDTCASKELLMLGRGGGRRVFMNGEPAEFFNGLDKYFAELRLAPATVKYALSREIAGLEILLANDDLHSETVWKDGDDMRVAISDKTVRKRVKEEIERAVDDAGEREDAATNEENQPDFLRAKLTTKREYDGYSWRKIVGGSDAGPAAQPPQIEVIPLRDSLAVQPTQEQWKARGPNFEIRASDAGLFKVVNGKITKLQSGYSESPVITPDGKWLIAYHTGSGGEDAGGLVRINLQANRMFPVKTEDYQTYFPTAFIASVNKVLLVEQKRNYLGEGEAEDPNPEKEDAVQADPQASEMVLLDPETGALQPASGEFRPLAQQTFRPLQKAAKPNEFWAAIADTDKRETVVGIFDTNHFGFAPVLRIPKITFNSMSMWVDEPGNKVYFVYRGHLLSLPLKR